MDRDYTYFDYLFISVAIMWMKVRIFIMRIRLRLAEERLLRLRGE